MEETLGRRINHLLWAQGVLDDIGKPYEQKELVAWLSGEQVAPNGRKYKLESANASTISRIINDRMQRPPLEILTSICEIFNRSLDWLIVGKEHHDATGTGHDVFMTEEAGVIAKLIDHMDEADRQCLLRLCQRWARLSTEADTLSRDLVDTQKKLLYVLDQTMEHVPERHKATIRELIALTERSTPRLSN